MIEDFINKFELPFSNFSVPIQWADGFGFSFIEDYRDGYASLYKLGIYDQKELANGLKKIWVSVSYGKKNDDGVSLGTPKNGLLDPLDLDFQDEFFYNEKEDKFFHYNKEINAKNLILYIEKIHKKPTKIVRGILLRSRLWFWRIFIPNGIKIFDRFLILILRIISGEKLQKDIWERLFSKHFSEQSNKQLPSKEDSFENRGTMEFFGYKAKRWAVVFYCLLQLIIYIFYFYLNIKINIITNIFKNNFLSICYVVVTFALTEYLIPLILKRAILKANPRVFNRVISKRIRLG